MVFETTSPLSASGRFISLWELFAQVGKAESVFVDEAARYLMRCIDSDPVGINYLRHRDESGIVLPMEMNARLRLLHQLGIFASQGTLLDVDDRPTDDAQAIFERAGFYTSEIYRFLAQHDVAVWLSDGEVSERKNLADGRPVPRWLLAYDGQTWISRSRAAKILIAAACAELRPSQYDDLFFKWDEALADAIQRKAIRVAPGKDMLSHCDIRGWCSQHGYAWPLDAPNHPHTDGLVDVPSSDLHLHDDKPEGSDFPIADNSLKKREQQVRAIEVAADELGYPRLKIPDGGKQHILNLCKSQFGDLFGGGDSPFEGAWKAARKANRVMMANHGKFAGR